MKFTNVAAFVALLAAGLCFADPRTQAQIDKLAKDVAAAYKTDSSYVLKNAKIGDLDIQDAEADEIAKIDGDKTETLIKDALTKVNNVLKAKERFEAVMALNIYELDKFEDELKKLKDHKEVDANRRKVLVTMRKVGDLTEDDVKAVLDAEAKALPEVEMNFKVKELAKLGAAVADLIDEGKKVEVLKIISESEYNKLKTKVPEAKIDAELFKTVADTPSWFSLKNIAIAGGSIIGIASLGALVYHFTRENTEEQTDL